MQAGADFIKTSTGKEEVNATLPVSLVMVRALRDFGDLTGERVGFKPAGGLRTATDALRWLVLMKEELGRAWLEPDLFRFGASSHARRHRTPARTLRDRSLRGAKPPRDGVTMSGHPRGESMRRGAALADQGTHPLGLPHPILAEGRASFSRRRGR